jgi:gluconate 5-dehydrogenase
MLVSDWDEVVATNLSAVFYVSRVVARGMVRRGSGKIINIGSVVTALARKTLGPYAASKSGVAMLTKVLAADLSGYNIQVNTLSPGYFRTEMNTALINDPVFDTRVSERTPAGRWGLPEELVGTLIYLSSDASNFVTGQNIIVDGGMTSTL